MTGLDTHFKSYLRPKSVKITLFQLSNMQYIVFCHSKKQCQVQAMKIAKLMHRILFLPSEYKTEIKKKREGVRIIKQSIKLRNEHSNTWHSISSSNGRE